MERIEEHRQARYAAMTLMAFLGGLAGGALIWFVITIGLVTIRTRPLVEQAALPPAPAGGALVAPLAPGALSTELETRIAGVYQRASPSVVHITNRSLTFDFYANPIPQEGTGSGFFYDSQGHIVTNYHVIADAQELHVTIADGRSLPASVVGADPSNDLAVIRVELPEREIPVAAIGDSAALQVGQYAVAIGNPFGLERTLTSGVISALGRVITSPNNRFIGEAIQTDTPINPGNSGGPLLNLAGEVIGVNTAILSPSGASAGIGFAVPGHTIQRVVPVLIRDGRYPHPTLGIQTLELSPELVSVFEQAGVALPVEQGLLIVALAPDGPAARAGLRGGSGVVRVGNLAVPVGGDIITAIEGEPITSNRELIVYLDSHTSVGETVRVAVIRDGQEQQIPVTLGELADL